MRKDVRARARTPLRKKERATFSAQGESIKKGCKREESFKKTGGGEAARAESSS